MSPSEPEADARPRETGRGRGFLRSWAAARGVVVLSRCFIRGGAERSTSYYEDGSLLSL